MKKSTLIQSIIIALLLVATVSVYTQNMSLKKKVEKYLTMCYNKKAPAFAEAFDDKKIDVFYK